MTFEENLSKLESLTNDIKRTDISLEDALKDFEEGIKLAKKLEESLDKIEGQILILTNQPLKAEDSPSQKEVAPQMELFSSTDSQSGSSGAPTQGLRQ
ncbi:exodeoxyribonuclease VII small subunit [Treponema pectinovorum]|uniref:exodeoxyribonuclease VII small subunit n=1 Tax=Treponema pectinovorum TaxID=164 RepID=UPI0011C79588|nr:exodeoxyribonuclease VII small subunit [Treponema pectinovorum]